MGGFLRFLEESGRLDRATVILMADHGQGRGIGGHGHLDWGETPVPFVVWGEGALPGAVSRESRSVLELAATIARLLGLPQPEAARGRTLVPVEDPRVQPARVVEAAGVRRLAIVVARDEEPVRWAGGVLAWIPSNRLRPADGRAAGGRRLP